MRPWSYRRGLRNIKNYVNVNVNDLNPLINYVLRIQFRYKMLQPLITLLHTSLA